MTTATGLGRHVAKRESHACASTHTPTFVQPGPSQRARRETTAARVQGEGTTAPAERNCVGADPRRFDDEQPYEELIATAREFCATCPARLDCYTEATRTSSRRTGVRGLWGGWLFTTGRPRNLLLAFRPPAEQTYGEAPCGTRSAAERHLRNGEPLDRACLDARRTYYRNRQRQQQHRRRRAS